MSGRGAALGVAVKNARRNKKRTFYLATLIGLPVLVAVMTSAVIRAGYISPLEQAASEFGAANIKIERWFTTPAVRGWTSDAIADIDPEASVLTYRYRYESFGDRLSGRALDIDLHDPLAAGILALTQGRTPEASGEVVLTEYLASELDLTVGETTALRLFGAEEALYTVVGLASHPILWRLAEAVVSPEEMDLIDRNQREGQGEVMLVGTGDDRQFGLEFSQRWEQARYSFYPDNVEWPMPEELYFLPGEYYAEMTTQELEETRSLLQTQGVDAAWNFAAGLFPNGVEVGLPELSVESLTDRLSWSSTLAESPSVIGTAVAAVILAEVAFIAGAAFATGTRRRLREIGLLGANGAEPGQVKMSVVGEGLVAGLGGGALGSVVGLLLLMAGRPLLQRFVDRRIEDFPLSPLDMAGPIAVAVVACVVAAWLPAKTASNVPILTALQGRMPVGAPKRWVVPVGLSITAFGTLLLAVGLAIASSSGSAVALIGAVLMIGGAALLAGPIVAWVSKHAERFPISSRIVLRDSGRQRGRAAAAVAATMVILMAPVAALAALGANEASQAIYGLPERNPQILIEGTFDENNSAPLTEEDFAEVADRLPDARIARFDVIDARVEFPAELEARKSGTLEDQGGYYLSPFRVAVANDGFLALLNDDRLEATLSTEGMALIGVAARDTTITLDGEEITVAEVPVPVTRFSFPRLVVTEEAAATLDGASQSIALVERDRTWFENPFADPFDALWADGGGEFVTSGGAASKATPTVLALGLAATIIVVLIVVATITALSAAEADGDLRMLVAVGATNSIRRRYLGLQGGLHTMIGALLAVPLTLLLYKTVMLATTGYRTVGHFDEWEASTLIVPWSGLAVLILGLPLLIGLITALTVRSAPTTPPRRAT